MKDIENICLSMEKENQTTYHAVAPEIVQTSSFQFENFDHYLRVNTQGEFAYTYTRGNNPTLEILEKKIADLEGAQKGRAFASGMGAISGTILSLVEHGDHVIIVNTVYGSSVHFIQQLEKFNIESTKIDVKETQEIFSYVKGNTKLIYFESPSSQKFELLDLEKISEFAKERNIYTVIDNTWSTPLIQKPLKHGVDVVIHSCSKYIGGHSDIVGGIVLTNEVLMKKIDDFALILLGATMAPMNAWLAIRGLRTLPVRLKAQQQSVIEFIDTLKINEHIETIYHPYASNGEQQKLSEYYLDGYGSLLSVVLKDATPDIIQKFVDSLEYFTLAYSWGGFESLILPVYKGSNIEELKQRGLSLGHLRVYIGLEEPELLIQDFLNALHHAYQ